ncbi:MAG: hypothetical protein ACLQVI_27915 [Polyangiaceae bacterium]|jgi:hypothetical protein
MRRLRVERFLVSAALVAAAMVCGRAALADDAKTGDAKDAKEAKDAKKDDKAEEPMFFLGADFVVGSARTAEVTGIIAPGTTAGLNGQTTVGTARVTNYSSIVEGAIKLTPGFSIGMRIPLEGGVIFANPYTRSDGGVGDFELAARGVLNLSDMLNLELTLGFTLPTAGGDQIPANAASVQITQGAIDQSGFDRQSVQRAISMSRGYEDDELFEINHFGINPKVGLRIGKAGKFHFTPWVKLDNLIATNKSYPFIDELLFGADLGAFLIPEFEPTVKIWANVPLTGADFTSAVAVVEPQLKFHIGDVTPFVGGILPIAGPITNPYAYGVRVGIGARF